MRERVEFYKRLEPNDATRDEAPQLPDTPITHRIRVQGAVSSAVWKVLYTNPDPQAMLQIDALAQQASLHTRPLNSKVAGPMEEEIEA